MQSMRVVSIVVVMVCGLAFARVSAPGAASRAGPAARPQAAATQAPESRARRRPPARTASELGNGSSIPRRDRANPPAVTAQNTYPNQIIDVYDPATRILTVPLVQYRERFYRNLQVRLASFNPLPFGTATATSGVFDRFDASGSRLTVPVVRSGSTFYYNNSFEVERVINSPTRMASYTVPLDLATVSYPASYQTPTADPADVNLDPCNLGLNRVTYPASWLGQYPLPPVTGAPLPASYGRGLILKDVGLAPGTNPAFIMQNAPGAPAGCTGSLQAELAKTMQRLNTLKADYIEVSQWHWVSARPDGSWYFTPAEETFGSITDADLAGLVQKAHAQGIKVVMRNQIQAFMDDPNVGPAYIPPHTQANYEKWFAAYDAYITERASYFQQLGIDVWEIGCMSCMYHDGGDGSPAAIAYFISQYNTVLDHMKAIYTGKTLMANNEWLYVTPSFASRLDVIYFLYISLVPSDPLAPLTVADYKAVITQRMQVSSFGQFNPLGKQYMFAIGMQSRSNALTLPGYVEESVCTAGFGDFNPTTDACIQRETIPDFSLQAIAIEGALEAIKDYSFPVPPIVSVGDYWETDSLMPFTAFPQMATSVRNKPAEGILKAWFAR